MSAHQIKYVVLTIAAVLIANAHIVVARSASIPSEMLRNMDSDPAFDKMTYEEYQRFIESLPYGKELEQAPAYPESSQNYEKSAQIEEQLTNNVDEMPKSVEEYPEALPEPLPLSSGLKPQNYKKSGPIYHMTICHFKICNMGRKRDTSYQKF